MPDGACTLLPWDSEFFGVRIARLTPSRLTPESVSAAFEWCGVNRIDCLYFLADSDHRETTELAQSSGFQFVDIRATLVHHAAPERGPTGPDNAIRLFQPADLATLQTIARASHHDSRFFFDGRFPEHRSEDLFETWITRSCQGWAQAVFVAESDGVPSGYCTCHVEGGSDSIGLVALAQHAQGHGLGRRLIRTALSYFNNHDIAPVKVVTQGRNARGQRLYQECGFVTDSVMLWFHKWFR